MDALIPAFVATALAEFSSTPAALERPERASILLSLVAAILIAGIAAASGWWVSAELTPEARTLMLGLALACAGLFASDPKRGSVGTIGTIRAWLGGGAPFIVFAIALRATTPALAAVGGCVGMLAIVFAKPLLENRPLRAFRLGARAVLLVAGLLAALTGLRLI